MEEKGMDRMRLRLAAENYNTLSEESPESEDTDAQQKKKKRSEWTRTEKQLVVLLVVCVIILFLLAVLLIVNFVIIPRHQVCTDATCVEVSGSFIRFMNLSADPCDDFYEYACGNFINVVTVPPDKPKYSTFAVLGDKNSAFLKRLMDSDSTNLHGVNSPVVTKAKDIYRSCMNMSITDERGISPILKVIKDLGSWSLTGGESGSFDEGSWDLQTAIQKANMYNSDIFFGYSVGIDDKNSQMQLIVFDQPGLQFERDFYLGKEKQKYHDAFEEFFVAILRLLGGSKSEAKIVANNIWDLETKLAKIQMSKEERRDQAKIYHKMTIAQVKENIGDWIDLGAVLKSEFGEDIPDSEVVVHYAPDYFSKLQDIVSTVPKQQLADYIVWNVIDSYLSYLPSQFREASLILSRRLSGVDTLPPLWHKCIGRVESYMPYVTGTLYSQESFTQDEKESVESILASIIAQFRSTLPTLSWMDRQTMQRAINKLDAVKQKIGYPSFTDDVSKIEARYEKLEVTADDQFQNALNAVKFLIDRMVKKRGQPPDSWEWGMPSEQVNAYYDPQHNEMVFPAGILARPFYDPKYPMAVNYGGIGMVMGHELTHGFDDQGSQFDKYGNLKNWWGNASLKSFKEKTKCIIDQYSKYTIQGEHVNGEYTVGENIADNGGIKTSFYAYKKWLKENGVDGHETNAYLPGLEFSEEQLFFLGFSQVWCAYTVPEYAVKALVFDPHSPSTVRVQATLSNMPEFSAAFKCKSGSPMNPEKKCAVW